MDQLFEFGLETTAWLQATYPQLEELMVLVSDLGRFEVYLALVVFIYWCVDKRRGKHLGYLLIVGGTAVVMLKHLLRPPRPFWFDVAISIGESGEGYGFPSGHTFLAVMTFVFIPIWVSRKRWVLFFSIAWIILTMLSRVYLGDHFPHDLAGGAFIALACVVGYAVWMGQYHAAFSQRILGQRFWLGVLLPFGAAATYIGALIIIGQPTFSAEFLPFATAAELFAYEDVTFSVAVWFGLGIGFTFEKSRVRFLVDGTPQMRFGRFLLGLILVLGVQFGLRALFNMFWPIESGVAVALILRFIRYYIVAMLSVYYVPRLFAALGMVDVEPEPQIVGSLNRLKTGL